MNATEIYEEFIKLTDVQKANIIKKFENEGADVDTVVGLKWLACLSSEQLKSELLSQMFEASAQEKIMAR